MTVKITNNWGGKRPGSGRPKKRPIDELVGELWELTGNSPKLQMETKTGAVYWHIKDPFDTFHRYLCSQEEGIYQAYKQAIKIYAQA